MRLNTAIRNVIEQIEQIEQIESRRLLGRAAGVLGLMVEVAGLDGVFSTGVLSDGGRDRLQARGCPPVVGEAVGLRRDNAVVLRPRGLPATYEDIAAPDTDGRGEKL